MDINTRRAQIMLDKAERFITRAEDAMRDSADDTSVTEEDLIEVRTKIEEADDALSDHTGEKHVRRPK